MLLPPFIVSEIGLLLCVGLYHRCPDIRFFYHSFH
jgi:hypothetical protein